MVQMVLDGSALSEGCLTLSDGVRWLSFVRWLSDLVGWCEIVCQIHSCHGCHYADDLRRFTFVRCILRIKNNSKTIVLAISDTI